MNHITGAFAAVATAIAENGSNINHVDLHEGSNSVRQIDFISPRRKDNSVSIDFRFMELVL